MAGRRCSQGPRWQTPISSPVPGKATSTPTSCSCSGIPRWPTGWPCGCAVDHHDAQDIAQEALIAGWENLDRFRADSSFSTWLYQIVTRRALNKVTRRRGAGSLDLLADVADPGAEPAAQTERNLAVDAVTGALAALPLAQRAVVVLHHFEGLSYAEVADVTRSTVPAVRSHLFRARRTLGTKLEEWR